MIQYRPLSPNEINDLENQKCYCEDWNRVEVVQNFTTKYCRDIEFSGDIKLGLFGKSVTSVAGMPKRSGIYTAHIHNSTIHDGVYIRNISNGIANYTIEEDAFIENVELLAVDGKTSFGNGVLIPVMNEQGGRAIPMFSGLTAQIAYMLAFYRHKPQMMEILQKIIAERVEKLSATHAIVGKNTRIINCETITNVMIGENAHLHGVKRLNNSTINSCSDAPIEIGNSVIADSVIINGNSRILDGALIDTCFLAEGCELSKHFSAENSLFFSNFIGHHGEAFAIFAGPHTATHHKSTLLISAYLSFLNAGSGSNQSNHMYKLGPLHQGVIDRGSKTGSNSYVMWPSHIGAFTLILGRHMNHPDISELPYSYLIEKNGESFLIPGVNFKSVGTIRDADKWPIRDKRSPLSKDIINYDLLNPYTVGKIKKGQELLTNLLERTHHNERKCYYNGVSIPVDSIEKGIGYYQLGLVKYVGNQLTKRLQLSDCSSIEDIRKILTPTSSTGTDSWVDMAGLLLPLSDIEKLINNIEKKNISSLSDITETFIEHHKSYDDKSWSWCASQLEKFIDKPISLFSLEDLRYLLGAWIDATEELNTNFTADANKEFSPKNKISFGLDGDKSVVDADFMSVRGTPYSNKFITKISKHTSKKGQIYKNIIDKLSKLEMAKV